MAAAETGLADDLAEVTDRDNGAEVEGMGMSSMVTAYSASFKQVLTDKCR